MGYRFKWDEFPFRISAIPSGLLIPLMKIKPLTPKTQWEICPALLEGLSPERICPGLIFVVDENGNPWVSGRINTNPCIAPDSGFCCCLRQRLELDI